MAQVWSDLLFIHWPLSPETLRPLIPASLELDTYEGQAWIGVVPFRMSGVRPRGATPVRWLSRFPELNVRTYVVVDGKPGVYFFSLEAASPAAVWFARQFFMLPYYRAQMSCRPDQDWIAYHSARRADPSVQFTGRYRPVGMPYYAEPGTLEHWLTARYSLYTTAPDGGTFRGEIHHARWPLQRAEAHIETNTMTAPLGIELPDQAPLLHFARRLEVVTWLLNKVN